MAKFKFDGTNLKDGLKVIANVKGNEIREGSGFKVIANVKDNKIHQGTGFTVIFNIQGDEIRQGSGFTKIATMKDVDSAIEGPGKTLKAALWLVCCR